MRSYEIAVILKPNLEEEKQESLFGKLTSLIETEGGSVEGITRLGKRRLAYEVAGQREGHYSIFKFQGGKKLPAEIGRILRISDEVLRHMVTRGEE